MSAHTKTKSAPSVSSPGQTPLSGLTKSTMDLPALDPKLRLVKSLTDKGDYQQALEILSKNTFEPEWLNSRGVCLLRMHEFAEAIRPLRMVALNSSTFRVHRHVAKHIKINFALALFFGGEPAGGLEILAEIPQADEDPSVQILRRQAKLWTVEMNVFRRLDWYLNRIAPKQGPPPPSEPIGRFLWDLPEFA